LENKNSYSSDYRFIKDNNIILKAYGSGIIVYILNISEGKVLEILNGKTKIGLPLVNASLGLISPPLAFAGTSLEIYLSSRTEKKLIKVKNFYDELQTWLISSLDSIDEAFLETEYFEEILELIMSKILSNGLELKIKMYKEILINQIKVNRSYDYSRLYLEMIDSLNSPEVELIKRLLSFVDVSKDLRESPLLEPDTAEDYIKKGKGELDNAFYLNKVYDDFKKEFTDYKIDFHYQNLVSTGVLTNTGGAYHFTERGHSFINFILGE
jgi:hypothetical protein